MMGVRADFGAEEMSDEVGDTRRAEEARHLLEPAAELALGEDCELGACDLDELLHARHVEERSEVLVLLPESDRVWIVSRSRVLD